SPASARTHPFRHRRCAATRLTIPDPALPGNKPSLAVLLLPSPLEHLRTFWLNGLGAPSALRSLQPPPRSCTMPQHMLVDSVDFFRLDASRKLDPGRRSYLGQFLTPAPTAKLMASMFEANQDELRVLDAGAGVGSLTAAFVGEICSRQKKPKSLHVDAYEIDPQLCEYLRNAIAQCERMCSESGVSFSSNILPRDFIDAGVEMIRGQMFTPIPRFTSAIMNPPYRKINSESDERLALSAIGVETSNLYTGFVSIVLRLLADGGELVSITPRSFCNGLYFKPFRTTLLDALALRRIHVFESRQIAFSEDDVLQENVILHGIKGASREDAVTVSSSAGPQDDYVSITKVPHHGIVRPS